MVFSYGVTLAAWHEQGNLQRELTPYVLLKDKKQDLSVVFFTYGSISDHSFLPSNIELVAMGKNWKETPKILRPLYSFLMPFIYYRQFSQCQVLKTNQIWGSWVAFMASCLTGSKLWIRAGYDHYTNHLLRNSPFYKKIISYFVSLLAYRNADLITVTTAQIADFVCKTFSVNFQKITVHGNYIDTDLFSPLLLDKKPRVLYVGRLNIHKNIETLMKACAQLHLGLTIVGKGEYQDKLKMLKEDLKSDVTFLPSIPNHELPRIYSEHLIFCLPSLFEGNPKVLLEAMSCACAVVGNDVRGIKELICDKEDGLLFQSEVATLQDCFSSLLQDKFLGNKLGDAARKKIVNSYSLQSYLKFEVNNLARLTCGH